MAGAPKASTLTTLEFGVLSIPVGLYKTSADSSPPKWDVAGPHGGRLRSEQREAPQEAPVSPLGEPDEAPDYTDESAEGYLDRHRGSAPIGDEMAAEEGPEHGEATAEEAAAALRRSKLPEPSWPAAPVPTVTVLVEEGTDEVVKPDGIRRGIRKPEEDGGAFVDLTDGLAEIDAQTKLEAMRIVSFIRRERVPRERITGSYYLALRDFRAERAYQLLYATMRQEERVAVVKWTKTKRQASGVLVPHPPTGSILVLEVEWAENWRPAPRLAVVASMHKNEAGEATTPKLSDEELAAAGEFVRALSAGRDSMDDLRDDARVLREQLLARVEAGEDFRVPARTATTEATGATALEDAMKSSAQAAEDLIPF